MISMFFVIMYVHPDYSKQINCNISLSKHDFIFLVEGCHHSVILFLFIISTNSYTYSGLEVNG